ncbi:MAG: hypothetical protein H0W50_03925 [Parachlamydiaceae bacterium]|nr:hypothetical protein [Parachlamydiaceae bacterium]
MDLVNINPSSTWALPGGINKMSPKNAPLSTRSIPNTIIQKITNDKNPIVGQTLFDSSNFSREISKIKVTEQKEKKDTKAAQKKVETSLSKVSSLKNDLDNIDGFKGNIDNALFVTGTIRTVVTTVLDQLVDLELVKIPSYPEPIRSKLPSSVKLDNIFGLVSDAIGLGTGISTMVIKAYIRSVAMEEIVELKKNITTLSDEQVVRLEELVKEIHHEDDQFNKTLINMGVSTASSLCSFTSFSLKWMSDKGFVNALNAGVSAIGSGLSVISNGVSFHDARKNVKVAQEWAENFDSWIQNHNPDHNAKDRAEAFQEAIIEHDRELGIFHEKITEPTQEKIDLAILNRDTTIETALAKRLERKQSEIEILQQKIGNNELSMESVHARVLKFKSEEWINEQSDESLLSTYIDYHSVLDPTIKNALAQMITKKQEIQESFLKEKRLETGISLAFSNIMFGVSATLAIIGLAATPVMGAGLVLSILGAVSTVVGIGLFGLGTYRAYKLQPETTKAFLRGDTVRLMYFNARSAVLELNQSIKEYIVTKWQEKRDRIAAFINSFATAKLDTAVEPQVVDISAIDIVEEKNVDAKKSIEQKQEIVEDQLKEVAKVNQWKQRANELAKQLEVLAWKDFADQADLRIGAAKEAGTVLGFPSFLDSLDPSEIHDEVQLKALKQDIRLKSFDTLETFNEMLSNCDFDMLSPATKELLKEQLGINVKALHESIQKDPEAVKKALLGFFFLDDSSYAKFIKEQVLVQKLHTPQA